MNIVPSKSEKHMIFLLVPMKDVSALGIPGLGTFVVFFTSTAGGLIADGAMIDEGEGELMIVWFECDFLKRNLWYSSKCDETDLPSYIERMQSDDDISTTRSNMDKAIVSFQSEALLWCNDSNA